ncbi:hypothetical protein [Halorussus caseinilyticus]|uniref:Glycosyl hydrolase family 32 N-terminal domain-containing protein n=1 Tax=Halorussus caseinilyticus TaxID=3034025 RepID=A0ABD5WW41_9EURY
MSRHHYQKLGRIYAVDSQQSWKSAYAYVPTPYRVSEDRIRLYCAYRDEDDVGRVGFVDVDADEPTTVVDTATEPVLDTGDRNAFDHYGVSPASVVEIGDSLGLFYFGWDRPEEVRYTMFAGLALSNDGGDSFQRYSDEPILPPIEGERYARSAPFVIRCNGKYHMYYVAGDEWIAVDGQKVPTYNLKYKQSSDGLYWDDGPGETVLELDGEDEYGFGRPFAIHEKGVVKLWYSVRTRSKGYRIGYAESTNGTDFVRMDEQVDIDVSPSGWDSEMVCFPGVIDAGDGHRYMFYNGNGYGKTGIGAARLE